MTKYQKIPKNPILGHFECVFWYWVIEITQNVKNRVSGHLNGAIQKLKMAKKIKANALVTEKVILQVHLLLFLPVGNYPRGGNPGFGSWLNSVCLSYKLTQH